MNSFRGLRLALTTLALFAMLSCRCGIFQPRDPEYPTAAPRKDPLNFAGLLRGTNERFDRLDYEDLFSPEFRYSDAQTEYAKERMLSRINTIKKRHITPENDDDMDIKVEWSWKENVSVHLTKGDNVSLLPHTYRIRAGSLLGIIYDTVTIRNADIEDSLPFVAESIRVLLDSVYAQDSVVYDSNTNLMYVQNSVDTTIIETPDTIDTTISIIIDSLPFEPGHIDSALTSILQKDSMFADTNANRVYVFRVSDTVEIAPADSIYEFDYKGASSFVLTYDYAINAWRIKRWTDTPEANRSFFHPNFQY